MSKKEESTSWAVIILVMLGIIFISLVPSMIVIVIANYFLEVFGGVYHIPFSIWSMLAITLLWGILASIFK